MSLHRLLLFSILSAVVLCVSCKNRNSFVDADAASVTAELQQITQARLDANLANDREFYEHLLSADFQILYPNSALRNKQQYLEDERFLPESAGHRGLKQTLTNFHAYVDGQTAVATYTLVQHTPFGTKIFDLPLIHLDTYTRRDGEWKLSSMAAVDAPSWPDVAKISAKLYAEYAGTYEIAPEATLTVTNDNSHLFAQLGKQESANGFRKMKLHSLTKMTEPTNEWCSSAALPEKWPPVFFARMVRKFAPRKSKQAPFRHS